MGPLSTFKEQITNYDVYHRRRYSWNILRCTKKSRIKPQRDQWRQLQSRQKLSLFDQLWRKKCFWNNVGAPFQQNVLQPNLNPSPPKNFFYENLKNMILYWFCTKAECSTQCNCQRKNLTCFFISFSFNLSANPWTKKVFVLKAFLTSEKGRINYNIQPNFTGLVLYCKETLISHQLHFMLKTYSGSLYLLSKV